MYQLEEFGVLITLSGLRQNLSGYKEVSDFPKDNEFQSVCCATGILCVVNNPYLRSVRVVNKLVGSGAQRL